MLYANEEPYEHDSVRGIWIYGEPGTGKSHEVRRREKSLYIKQQNKWWDGYEGEEAVLLDDMDSNCLSHYIKIWADKYECKGEVKGGTIQLKHKRFYVTSNYTIEELFKDEKLCEAINRRFEVIEWKTSD